MRSAAAALSLSLGVLLLGAAFLGPLMTGRIRFHMSGDAVTQYVGGEVVTVLIALVLVALTPAWSPDRVWPPAIAAGSAAYVVYTFASVVAGQEYGRYPGNAERAFLLYTAITALAVALLVVSVRTLASHPMAGPRTASRWALAGLAVVVALLWLGQVAGFYRAGATPEYESATSLFWLIKYLDLGVVIPLAVIVAILQRSPTPTSDAAVVTLLGFLTCLLAALVLMALEMVRRDTPGASWVVAAGAIALLVPTATVWWRWLLPAAAE